MANKNGVIFCSHQFASDPFCVTYLIGHPQ